MEEVRFLSRKKTAMAITCLAGVLGLNSAHAEFDLNFQPVTPKAGESIRDVLIDCRFSNPTTVDQSCLRMSNTDDPDKTPFYDETVWSADGKLYYHLIIGDPEADFAQEYYVQAGWGLWFSYGQFPLSASEGTVNGGLDATPTGFWGVDFESPLAPSELSGNGTGSPTRVTFRQIVRGTGFEQEVIKAKYLYKPKITQIVTDAEMVSEFSVDMSDITYNNDTTAGDITNLMTIIDQNDGTVYTDFDMDKTPQTYTTAGMYTHTGGKPNRGLSGLYNYASGVGFMDAENTQYTSYGTAIYNVDWAVYWNESENVPDF